MSSSTLSTYLKKFVADGSVERVVNTKTHPPSVVYTVTSIGKGRLSRDPLVKKIQESRGVVEERHDFPLRDVLLSPLLEAFRKERLADKPFAQAVETVIHETGVVPLEQEQVAVELFFLVDKKRAAAVTDILDHLGLADLAKQFADSVYRAVYEVETKGQRPSTWREEIGYDAKALDIDATLVMTFDGRKIRSRVNWEDKIRNAEENCRNRQAELAEIRQVAEKERRSVLESFIADEIQQALESVEEIGDAVKEEWTDGGLPDPPSNDEVTAIIEEWGRAGLVEFENPRLVLPTDALKSKGLQDLTRIRSTIAAAKLGMLPPVRELRL